MAAAHRDAVVGEILTEARPRLDGERQKLLETREYAAVGAQFSATREQQDDDHEGLSSIPDVPSGT